LNRTNQALRPSGTVQDGSEPSYRPDRIGRTVRRTVPGDGPASAPAHLVPAERPASDGPQGSPDRARPLKLYTIARCAKICDRKPKTIRNLLSLYQLPRKTSYVVRNRHRQRAVSVTPRVAAWLQAITFLGDREALKNPPR
jgi:hypothetical protein